MLLFLAAKTTGTEQRFEKRVGECVPHAAVRTRLQLNIISIPIELKKFIPKRNSIASWLNSTS